LTQGQTMCFIDTSKESLRLANQRGASVLSIAQVSVNDHVSA